MLCFSPLISEVFFAETVRLPASERNSNHWFNQLKNGFCAFRDGDGLGVHDVLCHRSHPLQNFGHHPAGTKVSSSALRAPVCHISKHFKSSNPLHVLYFTCRRLFLFSSIRQLFIFFFGICLFATFLFLCPVFFGLFLSLSTSNPQFSICLPPYNVFHRLVFPQMSPIAHP